MTQHSPTRAQPPSPALLELVARARPEPDSDEAYFLGQLRAALVAAPVPASSAPGGA